MTDYDVDYFQKINEEEAEQAHRLADVLIWKYQPKKVIDIGCATGLYLKPFMLHGVQIQGIDYSNDVMDKSVLQIPKTMIKMADLTKKLPRLKADLTLCVEVMEHIPESSAKAGIRNIARTSDLIFFTAAQPGQGGVGHINCQPKEYWESLFEKQGLFRDFVDEEYLRTIMAAGYHMGWLTNNLMVFKRIA